MIGTKTKTNKFNYAVSCLVFIAAICINLLIFSILAMSRKIPSLTHILNNEPVHIISLDLPVPESSEPVVQETITDVIFLKAESTNKRVSEPVEELSVPAFPLPAERIHDVTFNLPGLPVNSSNISLLEPTAVASVGSVDNPLSVSRVDRVPSKIAGALPRYPQWARRNKLEAVVTLRFIVTTDGTVKDINIHEIDGDERFGREAIRAVSQWRFNPAVRAGKSINCWCFQKINFKFSS